MSKLRVDYYRTINQQKNFARSVGLPPARFTYPYSAFSDYQQDKSSHYYNADLKLVKSTSVGNHHEDCDEPECGTSNWYCDLCSDLNSDNGFEPAGVSEVYLGCGRSSVQCMLLLECDDEVSPIPHSRGAAWNDDLQLDHLRTDSSPVPISDEHEPAVAEFAESLDCELSTIDLHVESVESTANVIVETMESTPSDRKDVSVEQGPRAFDVVTSSYSTSTWNQVRLSALFLSLLLVYYSPALCLLTNISILARASLLTIALFPYAVVFVFDRGKIERGFSCEIPDAFVCNRD